jgi:hypothetical protein
MTKSIKQLNDNLIALDTKAKDLAQNLQDLYQEYLPHLITVVKRQLMVATYHICTQKYPDAFLKLSYSQRTKLQEKIKDLAGEFPEKLRENWAKIEVREHQILRQLHQKILAILFALEADKNLTDEKTKDNDDYPDEEKSETASLNINSDSLNLEPEDIIKLQLELDDSLEQSLIDLSNSANQYLQEANVLSNKIPNQILALALQAEENTSIVSGAPNLLSILIDKNSKSDDLDITPIVAICLRINDLEFHDSSLNMIKQKMSKVLTQLSNLSEKYHDLQQQYRIAQAESAWRASWYDD